MDDSLYGIMLGNGRDVLHAYFLPLMFCSALFFRVDSLLFLFFCWICFYSNFARLFLLAQDTHLMPFMKKPSVYVPIVTSHPQCDFISSPILFCFAFPVRCKRHLRGVYTWVGLYRGEGYRMGGWGMGGWMGSC